MTRGKATLESDQVVSNNSQLSLRAREEQGLLIKGSRHRGKYVCRDKLATRTRRPIF